ncbi:MAG: alpha-1,2-fucosyltransferase, partial [Pseudobutyrivibrio sp.]|nr:alpha-1,2-fucosyltransferase [Pseudobutyrivibrio sp.]
MIIVSIAGGLGNQLFQYAFIKGLKKHNPSVEVKADTSYFKTINARPYQLDLLGIQLDEMTPEECNKYFVYSPELRKLPDKIFYLLRKKILRIQGKVIVEPSEGGFSPEILDKDDVCLYGYWQNEGYFKDIREDILKDISFEHVKLTEYAKTLLTEIQNTNSVSVHVRRGDYLNLQDIYGGICTEEYYSKSIDYIKKTVPDARLFVFTDSPEWVKENWREEIVLVEDKEAENALSDMYLMSQCKHNIIANSTFS